MDNQQTTTELINGDMYCVYCCKKAKSEEIGSYHHRTLETIYFCNCTTAQREIEMNGKISLIKKVYSDVYPDYAGLNKVRYQEELKILKRKYNQ